VGLAFGFDSLNRHTSHISVPDTTAPTVNAIVIILKNKFQISTLRCTYCPGSVDSAANTACKVGEITKTAKTDNNAYALTMTNYSSWSANSI
jgi:hypothetical protein